MVACLLVAFYFSWRNYKEDWQLVDLLGHYQQVTDAATQIEFENVIRQLSMEPVPDLEKLMRTQTAESLEKIESIASYFPQDLQSHCLDFVRSATELKNSLRTSDPSEWRTAEITFRRESYQLSREIAHTLVLAGETRKLSSKLRKFATLKVTNDLMDRVTAVEKWHPEALADTEIAQSLIGAIKQNLGILSDELALDESKMSRVRRLARSKGLTLTQKDFSLEAPTPAALLAVTEYFRPQVHAAYTSLNDSLETTMAHWIERRRWISGLSLLLSISTIALGTKITRAVYQSIARPLEELATAAHRMEQGDLAIALDPYQTDEIGKVAHGFASLNTTVSKLDHEHKKLAEAVSGGDIGVRGDCEGLKGEWLLLVQGMNSLLDRLDAANAKVLQAQKMEVYAKMSGGIAHQFNNLLTVILGHVELQSDEDAAQAKALEPVVHAGHRAKSLVSQLQTLGMENRLQLKPISLTKALNQLDSCAQQILPADKISISIESTEDNAYVLSDSGTLQQSFMNLMFNARDALDNGGQVKVLIGTHILSEHDAPPEDWVKPGTFYAVEFRDNGPGIPSEILGRVFEPFFSTKDHGEGSGLGLSMIYGFARQCGGWTVVDSSVGQGASVTIYLPKTAAPQVLESPKAPTDGKPEVSGDKGTILLVEDDLLVCRLTQTMLRKLGYTVIEAHDGKEGLDALEKHHEELTLVVSDVLMPHLTGPEMIQSFQESRTLDCGVLFVTGYSADELPGQIGELGENFARLNKPFTLDGLQGKMSELLALSA